MNSRSVRTIRQGIRRLPGWRIAAMIRASVYTQQDIARRVGGKITQADVSKVIYRFQTGPRAERVWSVLEEMLTPPTNNGDGT